ncbi:DsbA family protein [Sphingomonas sp.]|uniref:DsbA family protein n=1 Tax=Sphingomonas sp. TaxID=28214 RepID=UPI002E3299D4|nr:thioredoxin domain-containing protein [Sphingomonas sp.]HEX4695521.1 thioredoxin domain-containing protein [Sphingomonas sp.]
MKMLAALAVLALALPASGAFAGPGSRKVVRRAPAKPPVPVPWEKRVTLTANGGFLVGNPAAKAKVVEYGSLTCPFCQRFHSATVEGFRERIATGQVSFEYHPFAVHSADPILHALLRCAGPANFLRFSDDFYDSQPTLALAYEQWAEANPTGNPFATAADRVKYADQWGFTAFATSHGLTRARAHACLADAAAFRVDRQREEKATVTPGVKGTPTLYLNGQPLNVYSWPEIDQAIGAVLGS